jgi:glutamine cyclotransferase
MTSKPASTPTNKPQGSTRTPSVSAADITGEYGPFAGFERIHGVTFDGKQVWAATGETLVAFDPANGEVAHTIEASSDAGTAFDGKHLYQIAESRIDKIDPSTGRVLHSIPAPAERGSNSGLTWAEGSLWVGQYRNRRILQVDPADGRVLRIIESDRFVTGVTWANDELWHGTWENDESELRRVDAVSGEVLARVQMPDGVVVSGLEFDGKNTFYCGGAASGKVRAVSYPKG